jgi:hypothetical protein
MRPQPVGDMTGWGLRVGRADQSRPSLCGVRCESEAPATSQSQVSGTSGAPSYTPSATPGRIRKYAAEPVALVPISF